MTPTGMTMFFVLAAAMLLAALSAVLRPLLRGGAHSGERAAKRAALAQARATGVLDEAEYAAKLAALERDARAAGTPAAPAPVALACVLAVAVVGLAVWLYAAVGTPQALDPLALQRPVDAAGAGTGGIAPEQAPALDEAIANLTAKLEQAPDDAQGWILLGRAQKAMQRFAESRDALAKALALAPDDLDVMVELAESRALASPEHRLDAESRTLIQHALEHDPQHERAQWLSGIVRLQDEQYAEAVAIWERLLSQLPPESEVAASVRGQIASARERGGLPPGAAVAAAPPPALTGPVTGALAAAPAATPTGAPSMAADAVADGAATAAGPRIEVEIDLAPNLKARLAPSDTLFVFARAPVGPRMPLAIQRLPVSSFPLRVTLDDSMGMMPALKLSQAEQVVVGARVSKTGNASPQPGDLEVISAPLVPATHQGVLKLVIASVVE